MTRTTNTRDRIRHLLKAKGGASAKDLAAELGLSAMAIRQHLDKLSARGEVVYNDVRQPRGRPARVWELTEAANSHFGDAHPELAVELIDAVEESFGADGLARLIATRSKAQASRYGDVLSEHSTLESRLHRLAELRTGEGYMAEVVERGDDYLLIENHCPICVAATRCRSLCAGELSVFRAVLGSTVSVRREDHIVSGDRRCVYVVTQKLEA